MKIILLKIFLTLLITSYLGYTYTNKALIIGYLGGTIATIFIFELLELGKIDNE